MGPEVVAISEKRCLAAALVGNILNSGQANTKAALRLAGQTPAVDPMEPGGGGISYYDGEKSIGGNTFGTDPAAACKNRHPSPICTQFEHHFHALKPHLLYHSF